MFLKKKISYKNYFFIFNFFLKNKIKNWFFKKKKSSSGRNKIGKKILQTKIFFKKTIFNFDKNRFSNNLFCIVLNFFKKNHLYFLIKFSNNCLSFIKAIDGIFNNFFLKSNYFFFKWSKKILLGLRTTIQNFEKIIFFEIYIFKKITFSKSCGIFSKIIFKIIEKNIFLISLASKKNIFVSGFIIITIGRNSLKNKKFSRFYKAGQNILLGKKQIVRGVAKNPVDHPHGGRTKTNKPEVSIWGWVTKNSH